MIPEQKSLKKDFDDSMKKKLLMGTKNYLRDVSDVSRLLKEWKRRKKLNLIFFNGLDVTSCSAVDHHLIFMSSY